MAEERLQKIIATAGIASRRKAEELIVTGHVSVNGRTITELGSKADIEVDDIKVDGRRLSAPKNFLYIALHKPKNVVTTVHDPQGRETVMQFFKGMQERIYPVGRLDYASEGLILLTNDGEFAAKLMAPSSHVTKTYLVKANGILTTEQEEQFRRGIPMHGRRTAPAGIKLLKRNVNPWYEVRLVEGRQNQIRIMFKHFGRLVEKLKRVKIGFLDLGALKPGAYRTLTSGEVERFKRLLTAPNAAEPSAVENSQHQASARPDLRPAAHLPLPVPQAPRSQELPRVPLTAKPQGPPPRTHSSRPATPARATSPSFGGRPARFAGVRGAASGRGSEGRRGPPVPRKASSGPKKWAEPPKSEGFPKPAGSKKASGPARKKWAGPSRSSSAAGGTAPPRSENRTGGKRPPKKQTGPRNRRD